MPKKDEEALKVTMDDVKEEVKPTKKQQRKQEKKKSKNAEDEDWEDEPLDKDALYKELDAAGFVKSIAGIMEKDSMIEFRRIVGKYTYIAFTQRREELMERRLEALKAKRMDEYAECLM